MFLFMRGDLRVCVQGWLLTRSTTVMLFLFFNVYVYPFCVNYFVLFSSFFFSFVMLRVLTVQLSYSRSAILSSCLILLLSLTRGLKKNVCVCMCCTVGSHAGCSGKKEAHSLAPPFPWITHVSLLTHLWLSRGDGWRVSGRIHLLLFCVPCVSGCMCAVCVRSTHLNVFVCKCTLFEWIYAFALFINHI